MGTEKRRIEREEVFVKRHGFADNGHNGKAGRQKWQARQPGPAGPADAVAAVAAALADGLWGTGEEAAVCSDTAGRSP